MNVCVIGGGLFGATAAVHVARAGHRVELYEARAELLSAASTINQYRLHRGYHYPRSAATAIATRDGQASFRAEYAAAIVDGGRHLYAVAREGSRVTGGELLAFCAAHDLPCRVVDTDLVDPRAIELVIEVDEARLDPDRLRALAAAKLAEARVTVHLATPAPLAQLRDRFDAIVIAAYAATNAVAAALGAPTTPYVFQVCEKPVVALPPALAATGIVVIDGPFGSLDPYATTGHHVLGHVVHAVHAANTGEHPDIPAALAPVVHRGIVADPPGSRFAAIVAAGAHHVPALAGARHLGSMFAVRTIIPSETDARPTIVTRLDAQVIRIFSGKLVTAVQAARDVVAALAGAAAASPRSP